MYLGQFTSVNIIYNIQLNTIEGIVKCILYKDDSDN
jgi:hypothetical protein